VFVFVSLFKHSLTFVRPWPTRVTHVSGAALKGRLLVLPTRQERYAREKDSTFFDPLWIRP